MNSVNVCIELKADTLAHFNQIYTGFRLLEQRKLIKLSYKIVVDDELPLNILKVNINSKKVYFDMTDHSRINQKVYDLSDYYFKRTLLRTDVSKFSRIRPLGFNYSVYTENPKLAQVALLHGNFDLFAKYFVRYSGFLSKALKANDSIYTSNYKNLERKPLTKEAGKITFFTRLWDPDNTTNTLKKDERVILNQERIKLINILRKEFKDNFIGGLYDDAVSKKYAPELIVSKALVQKKNYLRSLKKSAVGIANVGLEGSIGWKFAEYVTHSMAIVSNSIEHYMVQGDFKLENNYLSYPDVDTCVNQVVKLMEDKTLRHEMMQHNYNYYNQYMQPEMMFENVLDMVLDGSLND